ncbi:MAG TPA: DUF3106 domain-containing protein [Clostridia bacterium]|nr:DUF3106 domain-containing protein [Clostridia bacterium]
MKWPVWHNFEGLFVAGTAPRKQTISLLLMLAITLSSWSLADAQEVSNSRADIASRSVDPKREMPKLPVAKSPVDIFRELLAMNPAERKQFLANRPAESQKLILAKIREYETLKPEERELRLRVTELRWYLLPLMSAPATNRVAQLETIPPEIRKLVEDRLRWWDLLPPGIQKELLDNEAALRYLTEVASNAPEKQQEMLQGMSPEQRGKIEPALQKWQSLSEQQRQRMIANFRQFFELNAKEQDRTLRALSDAERRQIERTLETFGNLTPAQRAQCLRSFERFAGFSPQERQQFLQNAERWKLMTPSERQSWKTLVYNLSRLPPLPPGAGLPPLPPPPLPKAVTKPSLLVTN